MQVFLTPAVFKEIESIKRHIEKGCLSEVPAGFGTNRNENLHRSINHRLAGSHISVELAVALLSVFFHMWNGKRCKREESYNSISAMFLRTLAVQDAPCTEQHRLGLGVLAERFFCEKEQGSAFTGANDSVEAMGKIERLMNNDITSLEPPPIPSTISVDTILGILNCAI